MEHSWEVSVISHLLALIKNQYFNGNLDANKIATVALYHDITEVITGDLPTPIKYHSEQICSAFKKIESQAEMELLLLLPSSLRTEFKALIGEDITVEYEAVIKAADKISAYLKCQAELKAGNLEFEMAAQQISRDLQQLDQPEVHFFMENFAPSCSLTLDGLMQTN